MLVEKMLRKLQKGNFKITSLQKHCSVPLYQKTRICHNFFAFPNFFLYYYYFQFANGWTYGETYSESAKVQPLMKQYKLLSEKVRHLFVFDTG